MRLRGPQPPQLVVSDAGRREARRKALELRRRGVGNLGAALRFGTVGAVAAAGGALLALLLPGSTLKLVFAVLLGLVGLRLVRDGVRVQA